MRRTGILLGLVWTTVVGCTMFSPSSPPAPDVSPSIVLPLPGAVTLPTPRPTRTPVAPPRPSASPSVQPTPLATNPCPTPPPGVCCGIVFGSIQGTVTGPDGQPVSGAQVLARSTKGTLLGGCSDTVASTVVDGRYAFNNVPFGMSLAISATAPGFDPYAQTVTLPKGTIHFHNIRMTRPQ